MESRLHQMLLTVFKKILEPLLFDFRCQISSQINELEYYFNKDS